MYVCKAANALQSEFLLKIRHCLTAPISSVRRYQSLPAKNRIKEEGTRREGRVCKAVSPKQPIRSAKMVHL